MNRLFDCDTVWCCWTRLVEFAGASVWVARWWIVGYATLYAVGAGAFLLSLRLGSEDDQLIIKTDSWAYMLAHPMRYGGQRPKKAMGSICPFYARLFNMLLFVWPFLLVYFLAVSTVASTLVFLVSGHILVPDLHESGFFDVRRVTFPLALVTFPLALLILVGFNLWKILAWFARVGWVAACLAPALITAVGVLTAVFIYRRLMADVVEIDGAGNTVVKPSAFKETLTARKERFCKTVKFR